MTKWQRLAHWILDDNHNIKEADMETWAKFFEDQSKRRVAQTQIGKYRVSTVFLGIEHGLGANNSPLLFETMVFEGDSSDDLYCDRCSTWAEAEEMHRRAVAWAGCCAPFTVKRNAQLESD